MKTTILALILATGIGCSMSASAAKSAGKSQDLLIKMAPGAVAEMQLFVSSLNETGSKTEILTDSWVRVQANEKKSAQILAVAQNHPAVLYVQPNYKIKLLENYQIQDPLRRAAFLKGIKGKVHSMAPADNPPVPDTAAGKVGIDPMFNEQWGMKDIGVSEAWNFTIGNPDMIVAVIDTGVDYTHEDLLPNMWRNSKEISGNGIDDDGNGYIDDIVGWDFVSNDNLPYDLSVEPIQLLFGGGNPGHGTHCAGNVAARGNNAMGIAGVAPNVRIMALRFLSEKGEGTTADAIKAIKYAVDNGAKVLSNSWGSEGEDPADGAENQALRDIITYAEQHGTLFVAAAGNGHEGVGYDNDSDAKPGYPASYDHESIISVAALDVKDQLGSFSNWGAKTVDIGAPGVDVFSTMVSNKYSNKVISLGGFEVTWDGTSMATPHVAGAAALYWSLHPEKTWQQVKAAIMTSAKKIPSMQGKSTTGGKLDVASMIKQ